MIFLMPYISLELKKKKVCNCNVVFLMILT